MEEYDYIMKRADYDFQEVSDLNAEGVSNKKVGDSDIGGLSTPLI